MGDRYVLISLWMNVGVNGKVSTHHRVILSVNNWIYEKVHEEFDFLPGVLWSTDAGWMLWFLQAGEQSV